MRAVVLYTSLLRIGWLTNGFTILPHTRCHRQPTATSSNSVSATLHLSTTTLSTTSNDTSKLDSSVLPSPKEEEQEQQEDQLEMEQDNDDEGEEKEEENSESARPFVKKIISAASLEEAVNAAADAEQVLDTQSTLLVWAKCTQRLAALHNSATVAAPQLLTLPIYTARDAAQHADDLLHKADHFANVKSVNYVLEAWSKVRDREAQIRAQAIFDQIDDPSFLSYSNLLDTYIFTHYNAEKVTEIFETIQSKFDVPVFCYNSILYSYAQLAHTEPERAASKALQLLSEIKQPDCASYEKTLKCLARAKYNVQKMEELFAEIPTLETKNKPTIHSYLSLLQAYSHATKNPNASKRAKELLEEAIQKSLIDARLFTLFLQVRHPQPANTALATLKRMKGLNVNIPVATYNQAIEMCGYETENKPNALKIAFAMFKASPSNAMTIGKILVVLQRLLSSSPERNEIAKAVFVKAKENGMVDGGVIFKLQKVCFSETVRELLKPMELDQHGRYDFSAIPAAWCRNSGTRYHTRR